MRASSASATMESTEEKHLKKRGRLRLFAIVLALIGLFLVVELTGLRALITEENIRGLVDGAGPFGVPVYVLLFGVGQLLHLPGVVFVVVARAAWGPVGGYAAAYVGALFAVSFSFYVVRGLGGRALEEIRWKPLRKVLARLDAHPVRTVAILRVFLALSPQLNYTLALSAVRFRDYFIGSAIGLVIPIGVMVFFSDLLLSLLEGLS
ncbi:MAG: VTT domain-containing protein [Myxococcota bacterium]